MDAPWCSKVGILVSFRHDVILWRLRENLGERQRNVGKRLHGNRSGPSDAAESRGGPGPAILLPRGVVRAVSPGRWEELPRSFVLPTRRRAGRPIRARLAGDPRRAATRRYLNL